MVKDLTDKDYLLAEAVLKLSALQRILIKKGLLSEDEINSEINSISKELLEYISSSKVDLASLLIDKDKN